MSIAANIKNKINYSYIFDIYSYIFDILAIFYCLALWLEMAENWENPEATFVGLILLLLILATKINLWKFCSFIIFTTACFLYFNFPDVANHVNLIIFANLIILITASYYWLRCDRLINAEDLYQTLASPLRVSLVAVYFWAGFHKLNTDFFNPYFSCSNSMFLGIVEMLTSTVLGIPTFLVLGLITGIFIKHILPEYVIATIRNNSKQIISYLVIIGILSAVGYGILLYLNLTNEDNTELYNLNQPLLEKALRSWEHEFGTINEFDGLEGVYKYGFLPDE